MFMTEFVDIFSRLVSNIGFPIACCIMLYLQNTKQMKELTEAVNNNTTAISMLIEKIGGDN